MTRWLHHLAFASHWAAAQASGEYRISTRGRTLDEEGFIHMANREQLDRVAQRYYADVVDELVLLRLDVSRISDEIKLEVPPGAHEAYPHLFGPIRPSYVVDATPYKVPAGPRCRLHHVHIFAADIDQTIDFWQDNLGGVVMADEILVGSRNVMIAVGDGRLNVYDQPPRSGDRGPVHHLGVQTRDLRALVEQMSANGVEFRKPITEGEGFRYVMLEAPDGILLELFESKDANMPAAAAGWFAWE